MVLGNGLVQSKNLVTVLAIKHNVLLQNNVFLFTHLNCIEIVTPLVSLWSLGEIL